MLGKALACLRAAGLNPQIDSFEDRLKIQKGVYLLQKLGVQTGFSYGLYVHGPYSPNLAKCLFEHQQELDKLGASYHLIEKEQEAAKRLSEIEFKQNLLEIISTYLCLNLDLHYSAEDSLKRLREIKSFMPESDLAVGVSKAKQLMFKPTHEELEELKKELLLWDKASDETLAKAV